MELQPYQGWLALGLTPGLGSRLAGKLLREFRKPEAIFQASLTSLEACGIKAESAQAIHSQKPLKDAEQELVEVRALGCRLVAWDEAAYPQRLLEIYDPPPLLYVRGNVEMLDRYSMAIVGARKPTPYGVSVAEKLGRDLAERGLVIVSGMARGIDACAHRGALAAAKGATVGVLGTGLDVIYPKENKKLYADIAERGALVSEFPLGTFPAPQNFPIRNRLISGIAIGVLVLEAGEFSGTRVTARCALEQGREVFAVPGNVTNKLSWGPNTLIKQGAALVATWEDVWEALPADVRLALTPPEPPASEEGVASSLFEAAELPPSERRVYALMRADESIHIDQLVERLASYLSSSEIFSALFELELSGRIRQLPGKYFVRTM
jgi:DNA processing protein